MSDKIKEKKKEKRSLLAELLVYDPKGKAFMLLGLTLSAVSAVGLMLPVIFLWFGVREVVTMYPDIVMTETLRTYIYSSIVVAIVSLLLYCIALLCTHKVAFSVAKNMKFQTMSHLMSLPLGYFQESGSGKLRRTISDAASSTENYLAHQLPDMVGAFLTPIVVMVLIFVFDWRMGLLSLLSLVLSMVAMSMTMGKGYAERIASYQSSLESMNNEAVEYVRGISVVKTFGQTIYSFKRFHQVIMTYREYVIAYTNHCRVPMVTFQTLLTTVSLVMVFGGIGLFPFAADPKAFFLDVLFYIFLVPIYINMMMKVMWVSQHTQLATDALDRVNELLSQKPLSYPTQTVKPSTHEIEFQGVSFRYPDAKQDAVSEINFKVKQGEIVALVGASGGGKSTIATLIPRFWDVGAGTIFIGGVDVKNISESDIMESISFVFQNTNLYKSSILDNVREGRPNASEEQVANALKLARCEDIIAKLPDGIHTKVGAKGVYLSGGEAQRIALARAVLKDAPILLLDEATAFTDPENEHEIQLAMSELSKNKTVLMIAHRLSTVQNADKILLIEQGKIQEQGSHEELLAKKGKYFEMWEEYNRAFVWTEEEVL
ncbi:MAG: ABC transporter ATP-binding protein [Eubacteriales bacterium]